MQGFLRFFGVLAVEAALLGSVVAACKEEEPKPPVESGPATPRPAAGGSGGGRDGSATNPDGGDVDFDGGEAGVCTDLIVAVTVISEIAEIGDPPAGLGGVIADGTYNITDARRYVGASGVPGATGASYQGSLRVSGNGTVIERHTIFKNSAGAASEQVEKGTIVPGTGGNGTISLACPSALQESIAFTVNGNNLTISNLVTKGSLSYAKVL